MDIVKGSIVSSSNGTSRTVLDIADGMLTVETDKGLRAVNPNKVVTAVHPNPREGVTIESASVVVDLDRLSLDYEPTTSTPEWKPKTQLQPYEQLTKLYIDIETTGLEPECDRVTMIGLMDGSGVKTIITDQDERWMLQRLMTSLKKWKAQCLIGHNHIKFDLPFIMARCQLHDIKHPFTKADKPSRISASSHNGKPIEYTPIYWKGTDILDTFHQVAIWDKSAAKLNSYGLKGSTIALGLRDDRRLELSNDEIQHCWQSGDLDTLQTYLEFDLEDTKLLADFLLPVVWYQMAYVPNLTFQMMAVASPALKAQKVHQALIGGEPIAEEPMKYDGGKVELLAPGLHSDVAKIDVASLYPSIMLKYGICSKKDPQHRFLGWMQYLKDERLRLKALAKAGDKSANFQQNAIKILINGSYGFLGTGGYSFNDYAAAALVTAYGRKILNLMTKTVNDCGGLPIELDTDGILFSHPHPKTVDCAVSLALPEGIDIELELMNCGLYAPKAKNYIIVHPNGKTTIKGLFRKRNVSQLSRDFPIGYVTRYFLDSPAVAESYYQELRQKIAEGAIDISMLTITRKIAPTEKRMIELGLGSPGETVTYWFGEEPKQHARTGKKLKSSAVPTNTRPYWVEHYLEVIDRLYCDIHQTQYQPPKDPQPAPPLLEMMV